MQTQEQNFISPRPEKSFFEKSSFQPQSELTSDANSTSVRKVPAVAVDDAESSTDVIKMDRRGTLTSQGTTDVKILSKQDSFL